MIDWWYISGILSFLCWSLDFDPDFSQPWNMVVDKLTDPFAAIIEWVSRRVSDARNTRDWHTHWIAGLKGYQDSMGPIGNGFGDAGSLFSLILCEGSRAYKVIYDETSPEELANQVDDLIKLGTKWCVICDLESFHGFCFLVVYVSSSKHLRVCGRDTLERPTKKQWLLDCTEKGGLTVDPNEFEQLTRKAAEQRLKRIGKMRILNMETERDKKWRLISMIRQ